MSSMSVNPRRGILINHLQDWFTNAIQHTHCQSLFIEKPKNPESRWKDARKFSRQTRDLHANGRARHSMRAVKNWGEPSDNRTSQIITEFPLLPKGLEPLGKR
jgi:hypothetical protein